MGFGRLLELIIADATGWLFGGRAGAFPRRGPRLVRPAPQCQAAHVGVWPGGQGSSGALTGLQQVARAEHSQALPFPALPHPSGPFEVAAATVSILTDGETEAQKFKQRAWGPFLARGRAGI